MNDNYILKEISDNLGLTYLQAKILTVLMKFGGEGTAPDLYNHIVLEEPNVKRTTVYSSLEKLTNDKIVIKSDQKDSKHNVYGLTKISPKELLKKIAEPKEEAFGKFKSLLENAKEEAIKKNSINPLAYYQLKGRKKLLDQVESLISNSNKYILIQANVPMLINIFDIINAKSENKDVKIFIQFTWNPNPGIYDTNDVFKKYVDLLGKDNVALPHVFYDEIFSEFNKNELLKLIPKDRLQMIPELTSIHFIQLLTDEGSLLGVHFNSPEVGGHFTRDPYTTQAHYNIFFLIFETSKGEKVNRTTIRKILKDRIVKNFLSVFGEEDD